jgi:SpoVK/Ycf46/Vps4 family AAA+-type ATPase
MKRRRSEPEVKSDWQWLERYRVWDGNRKIFVYPENSIEPELRSSPTSRTVVRKVRPIVCKRPHRKDVRILLQGRSRNSAFTIAQNLAHDLGRDLFHIDLRVIVSKYIGETEKNLKRVFDAAKRSDAVLFFEEADALFGKRSEVKDSHDRYANIEVNYLLQRMKAYGGISIIASSRRANIDPAFLRRLRFTIAISPKPKKHGTA